MKCNFLNADIQKKMNKMFYNTIRNKPVLQTDTSFALVNVTHNICMMSMLCCFTATLYWHMLLKQTIGCCGLYDATLITLQRWGRPKNVKEVENGGMLYQFGCWKYPEGDDLYFSDMCGCSPTHNRITNFWKRCFAKYRLLQKEGYMIAIDIITFSNDIATIKM